MLKDTQNFERICRSVGIHINTVSFFTKPDDVFNLYKATINECEKLHKANPIKTDGIGWKGKGELKVEKLGKTEFLLTEHRKSKTTGEVYTEKHILRKTDVNMMLTILRYLTENGKEITYYKEIVRELKNRLKLNVSLDGFNGGSSRAKHYFPRYYYPLKILEYYNVIIYGGRGKVTLKNNPTRFEYEK